METEKPETIRESLASGTSSCFSTHRNDSQSIRTSSSPNQCTHRGRVASVNQPSAVLSGFGTISLRKWVWLVDHALCQGYHVRIGSEHSCVLHLWPHALHMGPLALSRQQSRLCVWANLLGLSADIRPSSVKLEYTPITQPPLTPPNQLPSFTDNLQQGRTFFYHVSDSTVLVQSLAFLSKDMITNICKGGGF
ncbi:hypothetical protein MHYP_G00326930 [Metynnis hypsauchen]